MNTENLTDKDLEDEVKIFRKLRKKISSDSKFGEIIIKIEDDRLKYSKVVISEVHNKT